MPTPCSKKWWKPFAPNGGAIEVVTTEVDALFDSAFLGRLESLSLLARQLVRGRSRAERRSIQRGASVEFAEYRPFSMGDDWRAIDWNVYARWRQLMLKLFVEEEDLHVHLLLDCTASMDWGTPAKFDFARQVVAGLAYITLANLDRAAVVPLGSDRYDLWRPSRGRHRFLQLLRYLAHCPVGTQAASLESAVNRWIAMRPRRGVVILVSDLFGTDLEDARKALDRLRYARHEVAVIQTISPDERDAGDRGEYELRECETGTLQRVIVDHTTRTAYRERFQAYQAQLQHYCRCYGIPLLQPDSSEPVEALLKRSLMQGGFVQ